MVDYSLDHLQSGENEKSADYLYNSLVILPQYTEDKNDKIEYLQQAREISEFYEKSSTTKNLKDKWAKRNSYCKEAISKQNNS